MVVFMPLKAKIFSYEPRDHASLSPNKGLENKVAPNTHDKNFICQEWLWHQFFKNQSQPSCLKFKFPAKNHQPIREQEEKPASITCNRQVPAELSAPKNLSALKLTT